MKKIYLLLLAMICSVGQMWAYECTVYCTPAALFADWSNSNHSLKVLYKTNDGNTEKIHEMSSTGEYYNGMLVYTGTVDELTYEGVNILKFQKFLENSYQSEYTAVPDYWTFPGFANKMYIGYFNNAHNWIDYKDLTNITTNAGAVYLTGLFNSWALADENYKLTKADGNHFYGAFTLPYGASYLNSDGNYPFKMFVEDTSTPAWGSMYSIDGWWFRENYNGAESCNSRNLEMLKVEDKILPITNGTPLPIFVEYYAEYSGKSLLTVRQQYTLNVSAAGWASFCAPFNVTIPSNVEVYYASNVTNSSISLTQITGVIPAGAGVLVKAAQGTYTFVGTADDAETISNKFKGTVINTTLEGCTSYVLAGVSEGLPVLKLYANSSDSDHSNIVLGANKAYMLASERPTEGPAPERIGCIIEEVTDVENVEANDAVKFIENGVLYIQKNGAVYTATGMLIK